MALRLSLLVLTLCSIALAIDYKSVINLTKDNIHQVFNSDHAWIIEIYAPWCGHCKKLAPDYEKVGEKLAGIVKVAAINGDEERELAGLFEVKGFPTLKIVKPDTEPPRSGPLKSALDYNGARTAGAIANGILAHQPDYTRKVSSKNIDEFLTNESDSKARVLLFSAKKKPSTLYKALSADFRRTANLAQIAQDEKDIVERFDIKEFPTLLVLGPGETDVATQAHVYEGKLKHNKLNKFIGKWAPEDAKAKSRGAKAGGKAEPEQVIEPELYHIDTEASYKEHCTDVNRFCFLFFLDPLDDSHKKYLDALEELVESQGKIVNVAWVNGLESYEMAEKFGLRAGFPAGVALRAAKKAYVPHRGAFDAKSLEGFVKKVTHGKGSPVRLKSIPEFVQVKDEL